MAQQRPSWLPPTWVALTGIDVAEVDRTGKVVSRVPVYVDARTVAIVAERSKVGTALLVQGAWIPVEESAQDVHAALTEATR